MVRTGRLGRHYADIFHDAFLTRNVRAQFVPGRQSSQIGGIQRCGLIEFESEHHRRVAGIVRQSEKVTDFMDGIEEHLDSVEFQTGIEGDPALEVGPVRKLRLGAEAQTEIEQRRRPIHKLYGAVVGVYFVPLEIENSGPKLHRPCELFREGSVRRGDSDGQIDVLPVQQIRVAAAGGVLSAPIWRGSFCGAEADHREKKKKD